MPKSAQPVVKVLLRNSLAESPSICLGRPGIAHGCANPRSAVHHPDDQDIGRHAIDLDAVKGVAGAELSRTRFQAVKVFTTGKPPPRDLLGGEHARDPLGYSDIGRGNKPVPGAKCANFVDDQSMIGLLWPQPHLPQGLDTNSFHADRHLRATRAVHSRQKR